MGDDCNGAYASRRSDDSCGAPKGRDKYNDHPNDYKNMVRRVNKLEQQMRELREYTKRLERKVESLEPHAGF